MSLVTALYKSFIVGASDANDSSAMMKIGILVQLLALAVLSVVLIYFVKKKVSALSRVSTHPLICT